MRARQWRAAQSAERHLTRVTAAPGRSTMRRPAASLPMRAPWLCRGAMRHGAARQTAAPGGTTRNSRPASGAQN